MNLTEFLKSSCEKCPRGETTERCGSTSPRGCAGLTMYTGVLKGLSLVRWLDKQGGGCGATLRWQRCWTYFPLGPCHI